jgi:hypothetical protein
MENAPRPLYEYNYDYDGRPSVGCDPLLEALLREHPQLAPQELLDGLEEGTLARAAKQQA